MFYQLLDAAHAVHSTVGVSESIDTGVSVLAQAQDGGGGIETQGVGTFLQSQVLPPLLGLGAIVLLTKGMKSNWSGVVTVVSLSTIGLMWFGFSARPDIALNTGTALARLFIPGL
ncbi:hypothetical protein AYK61_26810 [Rhodococcus sp. SBT000017]|uniref:hypothetical protein n=1 Tax=Rhodococcus sp. SBT000017 TaxID=1803385 RepID=UPI000EF8B92F|nr:hypothetical protein [Rhodococcus sp. SBT000017]RMB69760.1 hypothetical protein AYK61_26810 [Rhodococcus sp. SBT000017]